MPVTLPNGVVVPNADGQERISATGVAEMRALGASADAQLAEARMTAAAGINLATRAATEADATSRARDLALADQIAGMEGMTYVGAWQAGVAYRINDVVAHGGDSWARLTAGGTGEPGAAPEHWGLVARKGDGGGFGELSETDVTGLYDPVPAVIPDAYQVAVEQGYSGTVEEWLTDQRGERGPEGPYGGTEVTDPQVASYVTSETETRTALDTRYQRGVSAAGYGATGDGSTDDTAAIQAAIDAAATFGVSTTLPGGRYRIAAPLTLRSGTNLVLDADAVVDGTGLGSAYALVAAGGFVDAQPLTADLAVGAQSVTVATTAAYSVGDIVRVRSEYQADPTQPHSGEVGVVDGLSGDVISLAAGALDGYKVEDGAVVERLAGADSISVSGGKWIGPGVAGARWASFTACSRVKIDGVAAMGWNERGINLYSCADVNITSTTIDGSDQTGLGYSINISNSTTWVTISGCTFSRFRQAIAGGGGSSAYGRVRFVRILGNSFHGNRGVNSHSNGQYWTIANNHFQSAHGYSSGHQVSWNGAEVTVANNVMLNATSIAITIQPTHFDVTGVIVAGNHIVRPASVGIAFLAPGVTLEAFTISNNIIESPGGQGIYLHAAQEGSVVRDFAITGNVVRGAENHGIDLYAAQGPVTGGVISGNRVNVGNSSRTSIRLIALNDSELSRVVITSNVANGGVFGIATAGQPIRDCWVDSNMALGSSSGISGFAAEDVGSNKTT